MRRGLMGVLVPILVAAGVMMAGVRLTPQMVAGYFFIYVAGVVAGSIYRIDSKE